MRPQLLACVQMAFLAALAASSQVSVEVTDPFSQFTYCGAPKAVNVIFQTVTGYSNDGTPVVFKRYWASEITAAMALERLPDPLTDSTIRECANSMAAAGHDAFEFSSGTCTAIELASTLCCEDVSGSHVYVSELFDGGSGELKNITDESTGVTTQSFSPIVNISAFIQSSSSEDEDDLEPATGKAAYKFSDGKIYTFPVDNLDLANCSGPNTCGPFIYYNRGSSSSSPPSPLYFTDYCGAAIPGVLDDDQAILSHRGFGCEYMPDDLLDNECVVEMSFHYNSTHYHVVDRVFFDFMDGNACDGLSLTSNATSTANFGTLCGPPGYAIDSAHTNPTFQFRLSVTKPNRLGFLLKNQLIFDD